MSTKILFILGVANATVLPARSLPATAPGFDAGGVADSAFTPLIAPSDGLVGGINSGKGGEVDPEAVDELGRIIQQGAYADYPDDNTPTFSPSTATDLGPLALAEASHATFLRLLQLGFWKGLLGSLAIVWLLIGSTVGTLLSIALYLQRREWDRERRGEAMDVQVSRRRVRFQDEVDGGELEYGAQIENVEDEVGFEKAGGDASLT